MVEFRKIVKKMVDNFKTMEYTMQFVEVDSLEEILFCQKTQF